jgi:CubicO group peptidase (beta-lactamase class C family)
MFDQIRRCGPPGTLRQSIAAAQLSLALLLSTPLFAADLVPLPSQPEGVAWPTGAWPEGTLPQDLDRKSFDENVERLFETKGRGGYSDTRALLVVQAGRLVYERYAEGFDQESLFQSWSMAKSITNAFAGVLVGKGRLDVNARAPVPEWSNSGDSRRDLRLLHLLQMRSGLKNDDGFGMKDMSRAFISRLVFGEGALSPAAYAANVPLEYPIGEHWAYSSGTSMIIARLCGEEVGGGSVGTRDFLREELFGPIGMRSAQPEFAKSGEFMGGVFFHARARDWARFGYLYLRDGVWNGRRILPAGWVDFSRTANPASNNRTHGAHFWLNGDPISEGGQWKPLPGGPNSAFMAEGAEFQMVAIVPEKDLVAVRLGTSQGASFVELKAPFGPMISAFPDRP